MAINITPERNEDISLVIWLRSLFSGVLADDQVLDGFPETSLKLPSVAAEWDTVDGYPVEIGNRKWTKERRWYIDIFAVSKSQRDEYAFLIFNALDEGIPVYDYNEGFPPVVATQVETLIPISKRIQNMEVIPELSERLYYRATITFVASDGKF